MVFFEGTPRFVPTFPTHRTSKATKTRQAASEVAEAEPASKAAAEVPEEAEARGVLDFFEYPGWFIHGSLYSPFWWL